MKRESRLITTLLVAAIAAVDVLIIFDAFAVAYLLRFRFHLFASTYLEPAPVDEYFKAMVVVSYFWVLLFYIFGLYDYRRHRSGIDTVRLVAKAVSFGTVVILSLTYFYREFSFSRLVCIYAWVISIGLFSTFRIALNLFREDWYRSGRDVRDVVLIGSRSLARYLVEKSRKQPELGYRVAGLLDTVPPDEPVPDCPFLGGLSELDRVLASGGYDGVLIAHPTLGHYDLLEVIQVCERRDVSIRMVPPTYDLLINYQDLEELDGIPLVKVNEKSYHLAGDVFKRLIDITVAAALLVLTAPIALLAAWAIRREDGGPALFGQTRVGKDGHPFRMWKFRTMVLDAESRLGALVDLDELDEPVYKLEDDPRVTRIGRLLRRTSLDELPQLVNVLLGQMSLVGPRPEEAKLVELYNVWERRRLKALPGISGLQQIKCRGCVSLKERVKWDMLYVRKRSLWLDLWIMLRTVWIVLTGKGAR